MKVQLAQMNTRQQQTQQRVYCVQQGGELDTVTENGERVTYCQLSENERFEQWEYYRNNHKEDGES